MRHSLYIQDKQRLTGLDKLYIEFRASLLTRIHGSTMILNDPALVFPMLLNFPWYFQPAGQSACRPVEVSATACNPGGRSKFCMRRLKITSGWFAASAWPVATALLVSAAVAQGPLAAKVKVTSVAVYTGSSPLPKPQKILVYDFAVNPDDVQVDKMQAMRPRHLITGEKTPDKVAASAGKKYYLELSKALEKTGIPVEHAATGTAPSDNAMVVQGSFTSLKEGTKAERDTIGMGTGSANVQTKVDVHLKTP